MNEKVVVQAVSIISPCSFCLSTLTKNRRMISEFLYALVVGDVRNTIGCLIVALTLISCLQFYQYRLLKNTSEWAVVADTMGDIFVEQRVMGEETKLVASENTNFNFENLVFGHFDETDYGIPGFAYYDERGGIDEDNNLFRQEVVEITFDFGIMEGSIRRFLSRMHRL